MTSQRVLTPTTPTYSSVVSRGLATNGTHSNGTESNGITSRTTTNGATLNGTTINYTRDTNLTATRTAPGGLHTTSTLPNGTSSPRTTVNNPPPAPHSPPHNLPSLAPQAPHNPETVPTFLSISMDRGQTILTRRYSAFVEPEPPSTNITVYDNSAPMLYYSRRHLRTSIPEERVQASALIILVEAILQVEPGLSMPQLRRLFEALGGVGRGRGLVNRMRLQLDGENVGYTAFRFRHNGMAGEGVSEELQNGLGGSNVSSSSSSLSGLTLVSRQLSSEALQPLLPREEAHIRSELVALQDEAESTPMLDGIAQLSVSDAELPEGDASSRVTMNGDTHDAGEEAGMNGHVD
ncbi:hypothetical protein NX059_005522 [Plenodomus lindquistii]|nr:hypothetical protein NX059_005522 [Plenodomus lindquistii]